MKIQVELNIEVPKSGEALVHDVIDNILEWSTASDAIAAGLEGAGIQTGSIYFEILEA